MRSFVWLLGGCVGLSVAWACGEPRGDADTDCSVGSRGCMCTTGGGCDPGLSCIDGLCVLLDDTEVGSNTNPTDASNSDSDSMSASATQSSMTSVDTGDSSASATGESMTTADDGPLLDVGDVTPVSGCTKMDMLFVLDSSASMGPERSALAATQAFSQIIDIIEMINGGGVDYRIGVTDDKDSGFESFAGMPWFDSTMMDEMEMATAFNGAVGGISGMPATGCEHVLTSGISLLLLDQTGFVRDDALLVLVLLTDVDDYGAYDQPNGNTCGFGCNTPPVYTPEEAESTLRTTVKAGQEGSVAAIVIAGDPSLPSMAAPCDQPGICNCDELFGCDAYWGTKLYAFADLLGSNGYTANVCNADVPMIVQTALTESIDLACQNFEPEG
jgi:hypothetical protein